MLTFEIARALLWEQWRISRWELLLRSCFVLSGIVLFSVLARRLDPTATLVLRGVFAFMICMSALFSASWTSEFDSRQLGFAYRLGFVRPVATRWLVGLPILYSLGCSQLFFFGSSLVVFLLTGLSLPLAGPAAIVACTVCMLIAGAWSPTRIDGRIVGLVVAISLTLGWLVLRDYWLADPDPILLSIGKPDYFTLAWYEYVGLAGVGVGAIAWTMYAVNCQRHGEPVLPRPWEKFDADVQSPALDRSHQSMVAAAANRVAGDPQLVNWRSPLVAQTWYEIRRSAAMVLFACGFLSAGLFAFLCLNLQWEYAPRTWLATVILLPIALQFLAADAMLGLTHKQGSVQLSPFDAIRPLRCDQLMGIKILVVFGWSLVGAVTVLLSAAAHVALSGQWELWTQTLATIRHALGNPTFAWWLIGCLNILLAFLSSTAMLFAGALWAARHKRLMVVVSLLLLLHCGILAWDAAHQWQWLRLWIIYGYGLPVIVMVASLWAIAYAIRHRYLASSYFSVAFGAWLVYAISIGWQVANAQPPAPIAPVAYFIGGAMLLLPLASAACAPLAWAVHRHC